MRALGRAHLRLHGSRHIRSWQIWFSKQTGASRGEATRLAEARRKRRVEAASRVLAAVGRLWAAGLIGDLPSELGFDLWLVALRAEPASPAKAAERLGVPSGRLRSQISFAFRLSHMERGSSFRITGSLGRSERAWPQARQLIRHAKILLARERNWCKDGAFAQDYKGRPVWPVGGGRDSGL